MVRSISWVDRLWDMVLVDLLYVMLGDTSGGAKTLNNIGTVSPSQSTATVNTSS